jgi:hypothetical protein
VSRLWTCRRQSKGVVCWGLNSPRSRKCAKCGKPRPARNRPAHMRALDIPYEQYIDLNGGEHCGICGKTSKGRRLDRDHDHRTGKPRGLLCWSCNRQLRTWATVEWLRSAAAYLERAS